MLFCWMELAYFSAFLRSFQRKADNNYYFFPNEYDTIPCVGLFSLAHTGIFLIVKR